MITQFWKTLIRTSKIFVTLSKLFRIHRNQIFRLFHAHSMGRCNADEIGEAIARLGYCSKLLHSSNCQPISDLVVLQRKCKQNRIELAQSYGFPF